MPVDTSIIEGNRNQTERLKTLIASRPDLSCSLGEGWTVAVALAHMAFWDRRVARLLKRWQDEGALPDGLDSDLLNEVLLVEWQSLVPEQAAALALQAAIDGDSAIENADPEKADAIVMMGYQNLLDRSKHRSEHLDQIESALGK
jgi:hypothetical protein